ncbi:hypothetical protein FPJ27_15590 [Burkholderia sp. MS455]|uniref:hypothetical protein n=1 Tax=Burkholderia sp. MS455 TaxID=2811788 RepID=UPI001959E28A|nr:hypothetical protein [Burkholderia sp. MS455]QRR07684.1 hypothetical protein FPJ27_15590 [Burkholderia sp. MS455]
MQDEHALDHVALRVKQQPEHFLLGSLETWFEHGLGVAKPIDIRARRSEIPHEYREVDHLDQTTD